MGAVSRYWRLIRLDARGRRQIEEIDSAKAFFRQEFPELKNQIDVPDQLIQKKLLALLRDRSKASAEKAFNHLLAWCCLRCFISSQIEQVCIQLELQFGKEHGFTRYDLFSFVLDDTLDELRKSRHFNLDNSNQDSYQSMATKILQTFEPERAGLSTWTNRLVKHDRELNAFLLERGVYLVSDWAILNDTTPKQVQRILAEFHNRTSVEIKRDSLLLESYHLVYRRERLKQRLAGVRGKCPPPSVEQLQQIASLLQQKANLRFSANKTLSLLQDLAELLRQDRIYARGGSTTQESLDIPETKRNFEHHQASMASNDSEDEDKQFLSLYRQQFIECLDRVLEQVTQSRLNSLKSKNAQKARQFLTALELFHCQGKAMGEIASLVGLQAQYQVTRLLKLKGFRADIRQLLLQDLLPHIFKIAAKFSDPEKLQTRELQIEEELDKQIITMIQQAETDASTVKHHGASSLLSQRLCRYLKELRRENSYDL